MLIPDAALQNTCAGPDVIHCNLFFFRSNVNFALLLDVYVLSGLFFPRLVVVHHLGSLSVCILRDAFVQASFVDSLNASFEVLCFVHPSRCLVVGCFRILKKIVSFGFLCFVHPSRCLVMCILRGDAR